jgi:hypothetical protein
MDRRRLSVCANFVGYTSSMGYINPPNVSIKLIGYMKYIYRYTQNGDWVILY